METATISIKGIKYKSAPEIRGGQCSGCAADRSSDLCFEISQGVGGCIHSTWLKEEAKAESSIEPTTEPKYTVEEVLTVLEDYGYYTTDSEADSIKSELQKKSDPEYKQYLALKAKFGE